MLATGVKATHPATGEHLYTMMILQVNENGYLQDKYPDPIIDGYVVNVSAYADKLGAQTIGNSIYCSRTGLIS